MINFIPDDSAARRDFGFSSTPWQQFGSESAKWFQKEWRGDEQKLLDTRKKEIALCEKWQSHAAKFSA